MADVIPREQFIREYAERSGVTVDWLMYPGPGNRVCRICFCNATICRGWQMVSYETDQLMSKIDDAESYR